MSECRWIQESGEIEERKLLEDALGRGPEGSLFLSCSTDSFRAGHAVEREVKALRPENLLELRIFSGEGELCYRRSCVGGKFQWRIASEEGCSETDYMVQYQTLDINWKRVRKEGNLVDEFGNRLLYTTVGGKYLLPIDEVANSSKIIAYITYDWNGMAKISDYRLCGFEKTAMTAVSADKE